MIFFALGILFSLRERFANKINPMVIISMIMLMLYFSVIPGIAGGSRFRVPILPYISIIAALGAQRMAMVRRGRPE